VLSFFSLFYDSFNFHSLIQNFWFYNYPPFLLLRSLFLIHLFILWFTFLTNFLSFDLLIFLFSIYLPFLFSFSVSRNPSI
jgi:hypothetical protein